MAMVDTVTTAHLAHELGGQDALRQHPLSGAIRAEVVVVPEYPAGRGPEDCQSVLRLEKGDIVFVLEQHESGWWGGHKEGDETTGWFPGSIAVVKPLSTPSGDSVDYDGDDENSRALERDRRAVASPQGSRRGCHGSISGDATQEVLLQELAMEKKQVKDLEDAVRLEREWKEKYSEDVRRLEAEIGRVRTERDAEKQERERERREREGRETNEKLKQEHEHRQLQEAQERNQSEAHARMEQEVSELRALLQISDQEVNRLREEMAKKENQGSHMQAELSRRCEPAIIRQAPQPSVKMCSPGRDARLQPKVVNPVVNPRDNRSVTETSLLQGETSLLQGSPQGSASRDDSRGAIGHATAQRQASASVTRQLFAQPVADDPPSISARGLNRHTSDPQVQVQASQSLTPTNLSGMMTSTATVCQPTLGTRSEPMGLRLMSAQPPRPSPRGISTQPSMAAQSTPLQPYRSQSAGAPVPASPRGAKAIAPNRPPAAVRAIVSEIERRSTSQAPGTVARSVEAMCVTPCTTTPHRATAGTAVEFSTFANSTGAATRAASAAAAPSTSMRMHSNGPPPVAVAAAPVSRGRQGNESEVMYSSSPYAGEDPHVVFGMSPMGRPRGERVMPILMAGMSPSPSPKGPTVQERIRALQAARR